MRFKENRFKIIGVGEGGYLLVRDWEGYEFLIGDTAESFGLDNMTEEEKHNIKVATNDQTNLGNTKDNAGGGGTIRSTD
jgi:hypothetical protein